MRLWKLEQVEEVYADEMRACIVRAPDEQEARKLAGASAVDEGAEMWLDASRVTCQEVTVEGEARMILCDVYEG